MMPHMGCERAELRSNLTEFTMSLQKYRADVSTKQSDNAIVWRARWMGGEPLSKINNCRIVTLVGEPRATVYITSEPDTFFSVPAKFVFRGKTLNGYVTSDEDHNLVCHHCYY
jgi:hypothetical protein